MEWPAIRAPADDPLHGISQCPFLLGPLLAFTRDWLQASNKNRIFGISGTELRDEAIDALTPKSARVQTKTSDPTSWAFKRLAVSLAEQVTHVQLTETDYSDEETETDLRNDFVELAKKLGAGSNVLLNFTGVESFSASSIEPIVLLNQKMTRDKLFVNVILNCTL